MTLFHAPHSRSFRMLWLLEELGVPYELKIVNIRRGDGSGAVDPANPHPHGKVPALTDDGGLIFETPAIALYLTDTFPEKELGPRIGDPKRGVYLTWLAYYTGVIEPSLTAKFLKIHHIYGTFGWAPFDDVIGYLSRALEQALSAGRPVFRRRYRHRRQPALADEPRHCAGIRRAQDLRATDYRTPRPCTRAGEGRRVNGRNP